MAGFSYQLVRGEGRWYQDRDEYLDQVKLDGPAKFCQMMNAVVHGGQPPTNPGRSAAQELPWLTPVVGSGCLDIGSIDELTPADVRLKVELAVRAVIEHTVGEAGLLGSISYLPQLAATFAEELARDRMSGGERVDEEFDGEFEGSTGVAAGGGSASSSLPEPDARVVLVAALLSRLYSLAKGTATRPLSRWRNDVVPLRLLPRSDDDTQIIEHIEDVRRACVHHLKAAIQSYETVVRRTQDTAAPKAIRSLLEEVVADIDAYGDCHLRFVHLQLVTEVAWYVLISGTALYPGWSDLLFKLMLEQSRESSADSGSSTQTRPWFNSLAAVGEKVAGLFRGPSGTSWQRWVEHTRSGHAELTTRQHLYNSIAELMWAESNVVQEALAAQGPSRRRMPVPSAFAASFDLEVEMALMASAQPGDRFYAVIPFQVQPDRDSAAAKLCWLRAEFRRGRGLGTEFDEIFRPERWELMHKQLEEGLEFPHVVHLSGCPLINPPTRATGDEDVLHQLSDNLRDGRYAFAPERLVLRHAVTIDEYLALQQSEAELLWTIGQASTGTHSASDQSGMNLALPPRIMSSSAENVGEGDNSRFWLTIGVPVSDPAIRSRIVTQLTLKSLMNKAMESQTLPSVNNSHGGDVGDEDEDEDLDFSPAGLSLASASLNHSRGLAGVVVNRRITKDEGGILYWLGLDVVSDVAEHFIDDIRHFTLHLVGGDERRRIPVLDTCNLVPEPVR